MPLKSTLRKAAWTNRHCSTCDRYVITLIFSVDGIPSWSDKAERNGTGSVRERSFIGGSSGGDTLTKPAKHFPDKPVFVLYRQHFCLRSSCFGVIYFFCCIKLMVLLITELAEKTLIPRCRPIPLGPPAAAICAVAIPEPSPPSYLNRAVQCSQT